MLVSADITPRNSQEEGLDEAMQPNMGGISMGKRTSAPASSSSATIRRGCAKHGSLGVDCERPYRNAAISSYSRPEKNTTGFRHTGQQAIEISAYRLGSAASKPV